MAEVPPSGISLPGVNRLLFNSPAAKIVGILLFVGAILTWALWPRGLPTPDEHNRVTHPEDAYSIIAPPAYQMTSETESRTLSHDRGWLKIEPIQRGYYPPSIMITVLKDPPDVANLKAKQQFVDTTFHGLPALVAEHHSKRDWSYVTIFQDHDRWFQINLTTADYYDVPHSSWWPYINSFKYEPDKVQKITGATTLPTFKMPTSLPASWLK
jgi:hypothetical protein